VGRHSSAADRQGARIRIASRAVAQARKTKSVAFCKRGKHPPERKGEKNQGSGKKKRLSIKRRGGERGQEKKSYNGWRAREAREGAEVYVAAYEKKGVQA